MPLKTLLSLSIVLIAVLACSKSSEEKVADAIGEARLFLTERKCDEALKALDTVGFQNKNVDYIIAAASAHACKGGYSSISFFENDLPGMESSEEGFFGSLSSFSSSSITDTEDDRFIHTGRALDVLLLAGGINRSSHDNRRAVEAFSAQDVERIEIFALYLILVQTGRFTNYFGNVNEDGEKGQGANSNDCYLTYSDAAASALVTATATVCDPVADTGHPEIVADRENQCYGIILFNNFADIIQHIVFSGENADRLTELSTSIDNFCLAASRADDLGSTCTTKTLERCVQDNVLHSPEHIERFYASVYESMHQ